jgi:YHS domain-containing protein
MLLRVVLCAGIVVSIACPLSAETFKTSKEALQEFNEFIGEWKGNGEDRETSKLELWKESMAWAWKIKGDDVALVFKLSDGKFMTEGTLRYLLDKQVYELTTTTPDKKELVFTGNVRAKRLSLIAVDKETKDKYTIEMSTNNGGARMIYTVAKQKRGIGISKKYLTVAHSKEGASVASGKKENECIVTGGKGTMAVSFNGKTYYVCCSGCRDEFMANPKKYVDAFENK